MQSPTSAGLAVQLLDFAGNCPRDAMDDITAFLSYDPDAHAYRIQTTDPGERVPALDIAAEIRELVQIGPRDSSRGTRAGEMAQELEARLASERSP